MLQQRVVASATAIAYALSTRGLDLEMAPELPEVITCGLEPVYRLPELYASSAAGSAVRATVVRARAATPAAQHPQA